jgi:hypothetical protein
MTRMTYRFSFAAALLLAASPLALRASVLTFTLGSATPSFTDGQIVNAPTFNAAVAGNAFPFNGEIGSDTGTTTASNFQASWSYNYGAIAGTISNATLTLAIWDNDAQASGNQVASFTVGGIDLTATLNTAFESHGGANDEYDIYTVTLPSSTFSALAGGTPGLSLNLQGPGLGILGATTTNGAGLDFSTLTITTGTVTVTPEPGTWMLLAAGIAGIAIRRMRPGRRN